MEKHTYPPYDRISDRIKRICRLYSKIGEPLDVNTIIDLYHHLDDALQMNQNEKAPRRAHKKHLS